MSARRSRGATRHEPSGAPDRRFAARARRVRTLRWRPILISLTAAALVAGAVWLVWFSSVLTVRQVAVEGVSGKQADQVRQAAAVPLGVPLARTDLQAPGRRVTASPLYATATVSRRWPTTILVTVVPRRPVLALKRPGDYQLVDAEGVAYLATPKAPDGVPVATGAGQVTPQGLRAAISVMAALPGDLRGKVSAVQVEGPSMVTFQLGQVKVLWGDETKPELKVKVIRALLPKARATLNVSAPEAPATT